MPADYVNKLARMFQDIKVSEDLNQEFKEAHRNNNEGLAGQSEHLRFSLVYVQAVLRVWLVCPLAFYSNLITTFSDK